MEKNTQRHDFKRVALVVDDLPSGRWNVVKRLRELGFSDIIEASDGDLAMEKLVGRTDLGDSISLIISDMQVPHVDGISFAQLVRSFPEYQGIPFIILASNSRAAEGEDFRDVGEVSIIAKPIVTDTFKMAVAQVLEDAQKAEGSLPGTETKIVYW